MSNFEKGKVYSSTKFGPVQFLGLNIQINNATFCFKQVDNGKQHEFSYSVLPYHFDGVRETMQ